MKVPQWYRECVGTPMFISSKSDGEKWLSKNYRESQLRYAEDALSRKKEQDENTRRND